MRNDIKEFAVKHKKEGALIAIALVASAILVGGFALLSNTAGGNGRFSASVYVPTEFLESRRRAANAAENISSLISESIENLEHISAADARGDYRAGLELIVEERERIRDISNTAVDLSEELHEMATTLEVVEPPDARAVGFSAVTTGIELLQRLVSYNNNMEELLGTLQTRLENNGDERTRERITELIGALNAEARIINSLNSEYRELMVQFDGLTE